MLLAREVGRQHKAWGEGVSRNPSSRSQRLVSPRKRAAAISVHRNWLSPAFAGCVLNCSFSWGFALSRGTPGFMLLPDFAG